MSIISVDVSWRVRVLCVFYVQEKLRSHTCLPTYLPTVSKLHIKFQVLTKTTFSPAFVKLNRPSQTFVALNWTDPQEFAEAETQFFRFQAIFNGTTFFIATRYKKIPNGKKLGPFCRRLDSRAARRQVHFQTKNRNLGIFWKALPWKMFVFSWPFCLFYCKMVIGNLVHFVVIWYIFPRFGMLHRERSGNPAWFIEMKCANLTRRVPSSQGANPITLHLQVIHMCTYTCD
jgi:hypothetical protein